MCVKYIFSTWRTWIRTLASGRSKELSPTCENKRAIANNVENTPFLNCRSRRKLKTSVYLLLRLAKPWVHLRWLGLICDDLRSLWSRANLQVDASFSPFGHQTEVNESWVTSINLLLANEIEDSLPKMFFGDLRVLGRKPVSPFGHPMQVSTQVELATCRSVCMAWALRSLFLKTSLDQWPFFQMKMRFHSTCTHFPMNSFCVRPHFDRKA